MFYFANAVYCRSTYISIYLNKDLFFYKTIVRFTHICDVKNKQKHVWGKYFGPVMLRSKVKKEIAFRTKIYTEVLLIFCYKIILLILRLISI